MAKETVVGNLKDIVNKWYYTDEELDEHIQDRALKDHVHDYYDKEEVDSKIADKADTVHTHTSRQVVDLRFVLEEKADINHTHPESYTKTEVDQKTKEMDEAIKNIEGFRTIVIEDLESDGQEGVLYLYADGTKTGEDNSYDEYIWTAQTGYEKIGSTDIDLDLSDYVTQDSLTSQLESYSQSSHTHDDYILKEEAETQLASKADKTVASLTEDGLMSSSDYNKLFSIQEEANKTTVDSSLSEESNNPVESAPVYAELQTLRSNLDEFTPLIDEIEQTQEETITTLTEANSSLSSENERLQSELEAYEGQTADQVKQLQQELETLRNEKLQLESNVEELEEQNEQLSSSNKELETQLGAAQAANEELQETNTALTAANGQLTTEKTQLEETNATLTSEKQSLETQIVTMTAELETIHDQVAAIPTYDLASATANGLMSSKNYTKLQGIEAGANKTTVDTELNASSSNPVQNKAINTKITSMESSITTMQNKLKELTG